MGCGASSKPESEAANGDAADVKPVDGAAAATANGEANAKAPDDQTEELKKQEAEEAAVATKIQAIHRGNAIRKGSKQSTEQQQKEAANGDAADVKPVDDAAAATANGEANAKAPDDQTEELKKQEAEEAAVATKIQAIHRGNAIRKGSKQSTEEQQKKAANGDAADVKPVDDAAAATANGEANAKAAGSEAKSEAVVEGVPVDADKSAQAAAAPPKSNSLAVPEQPEGRSSSKSSTGSRGGEMRLKKAIYDKKEQDKKTSPEELG